MTVNVDDLLAGGYVQVQRDYPEGDGLVHRCFGCSPANPIGMHLVFYGRTGEPEVITRYIVQKDYCGFPLYAHGGIVALLFDELLAYATYHVHGRFGVTKEMTVRYKRPVLVGAVHFLRAVVRASNPRGEKIDVHVDGWIHEGQDATGPACATATGTFVVLPDERVRASFIAPPAPGNDAPS